MLQRGVTDYVEGIWNSYENFYHLQIHVYNEVKSDNSSGLHVGNIRLYFSLGILDFIMRLDTRTFNIIVKISLIRWKI